MDKTENWYLWPFIYITFAFLNLHLRQSACHLTSTSYLAFLIQSPTSLTTHLFYYLISLYNESPNPGILVRRIHRLKTTDQLNTMRSTFESRVRSRKWHKDRDRETETERKTETEKDRHGERQREQRQINSEIERETERGNRKTEILGEKESLGPIGYLELPD